jgi:hypothetical protein
VSPVRYELGFYIPEDDILHSHCRENLKPYKCDVRGITSPETSVKYQDLVTYSRKYYF